MLLYMNNNDLMFESIPGHKKYFNFRKMIEKPISNDDLLKIYDDYPRLKRENGKISTELIDLSYKVHKDLDKPLVTPPEGWNMSVRDIVKSRNIPGFSKLLTKIEKHMKAILRL